MDLLGRWLLLSAGAAALTNAGCILLYSEESKEGAGGSGATGGSTMIGGAPTGGGGAGGGPAGGGPAGGGPAGGGGAGGNGGAPGCDDPGYCGPGSSCGPDGFCTVVSTEAQEVVVGVAFVPSQGMGPDVGYVVAHSSLGGAMSDRLSAWPLGFEQDQVALTIDSSLDDPGVGFIAAGGADHVYYFGQLQNCDIDSNDDSCISVCSIDDGGVDCVVRPSLTGGSHVNGAVLVPGANPMLDSVYVLESNDTANERLQRVSRDCLETNQQDCPAQLAANYAAADELDPLGLDFDPFDGSLWWNTWGGPGFNNACVYRFDPSSVPGDPLDCVPTVPNVTRPNRLAVSGAGVFVGTFTANGEPGPIQRISRCTTPSGNHPVTSFSKLTWPADADGRFLYATLLETPGAVQVIDGHTGMAITTLFDPNGNPIAAVDASNPTYLLFAAGNRIYRWRKPPPPCPVEEGPQVCGNGCVEEGEACDDANNNADDGCNACQCELP